MEGQGYGSLIHSLGYALSDEYYDDAKHGQLTQLGFRYADDCPDNMQLLDCHLDSSHKTAVNGSVGCCEGFQSGGHVAILNSIYDAIGIRVYEMPATAKKVKELLEKKAAGQDLTPQPYYLGRFSMTPALHNFSSFAACLNRLITTTKLEKMCK